MTPAESPAPRAWVPLLAALLINLPTGSLYAFSLFIRYYEAALQVGRAELSAMFSLAAIGYPLGMLFGPVCYRWARPPLLVLGFGAVITLGWMVNAAAPNLLVLGFGYGVLFGVAGGMVYSVLAQVVNLSLPPHRRGFGNGFLVATFSAGAMVLVPFCAWCLERVGLAAPLLGLRAVPLPGAVGSAPR